VDLEELRTAMVDFDAHTDEQLQVMREESSTPISHIRSGWSEGLLMSRSLGQRPKNLALIFLG